MRDDSKLSGPQVSTIAQGDSLFDMICFSDIGGGAHGKPRIFALLGQDGFNKTMLCILSLSSIQSY